MQAPIQGSRRPVASWSTLPKSVVPRPPRLEVRRSWGRSSSELPARRFPTGSGPSPARMPAKPKEPCTKCWESLPQCSPISAAHAQAPAWQNGLTANGCCKCHSIKNKRCSSGAAIALAGWHQRGMVAKGLVSCGSPIHHQVELATVVGLGSCGPTIAAPLPDSRAARTRNRGEPTSRCVDMLRNGPSDHQQRHHSLARSSTAGTREGRASRWVQGLWLGRPGWLQAPHLRVGQPDNAAALRHQTRWHAARLYGPCARTAGSPSVLGVQCGRLEAQRRALKARSQLHAAIGGVRELLLQDRYCVCPPFARRHMEAGADVAVLPQ